MAGRAATPTWSRAAAAAGVPVHDGRPRRRSQRSADTVTPQGVVAVCRFARRARSTDVVAGGPRLVVVLAQVRDPGNAGTRDPGRRRGRCRCGRPRRGSVDPYNGKCVRASAGSLFHLPVVAGAGVDAAVRACARPGCRSSPPTGPAPWTSTTPQRTGALAAPTAWLFGNEAWGLPADVRGLADAVVRVPDHGPAESLNLATAAAVCLYASPAARPAARPTPGTGR